MEVSSVLLPHCNCYSSRNMSLFNHSSLKLRNIWSCCSSNRSRLIRKEKQEVAARDLTIDFGRYKGKMLGTLPSTYLKWVANNLRARDFHHWANLADQVLADPVYRDRIEWEFAQKLLDGNILAKSNKISTSGEKGEGVSDLLVEISERFGWDNDDKLGWSKIEFGLLGTSKGSPIPRTTTKDGTSHSRDPTGVSSLSVSEVEEKESPIKKEISITENERLVNRRNVDINKRSERRERLRIKRITSGRGGEKEKTINTGDDNVMINNDHPSIKTNNTTLCPFPGRGSLFNGRPSSMK